MKYQDKLNQLTPPDLFMKSLEMTRQSSLLAIIELLMCCGYWLTHNHPVRYMFLSASTVLLPILIIKMFRLRKVDNTFERKINEEAEKRRQKIIEFEIELQRIEEEEGGEQ